MKQVSSLGSISRLLTVARARGWTAATTGSELKLFFEDLVTKAKADQNGLCDICRASIDDWTNVAPRQSHIVHLDCREWPRTWLRVRSNPVLRIIRKSVQAYQDQV